MANTFTFANLTLTDADIFGGINFTHDLNTGDPPPNTDASIVTLASASPVIESAETPIAAI